MASIMASPSEPSTPAASPPPLPPSSRVHFAEELASPPSNRRRRANVKYPRATGAGCASWRAFAATHDNVKIQGFGRVLERVVKDDKGNLYFITSGDEPISLKKSLPSLPIESNSEDQAMDASSRNCALSFLPSLFSSRSSPPSEPPHSHIALPVFESSSNTMPPDSESNIKSPD